MNKKQFEYFLRSIEIKLEELECAITNVSASNDRIAIALEEIMHNVLDKKEKTK